MRANGMRIIGAILAGTLLDSTSYLPSFPISPAIHSFLDNPSAELYNEGLTSEDFVQNSIEAEHLWIALSNLAEGCTNLGLAETAYYAQAKDCVAATLIVAKDSHLSPYGQSVEQVSDLGHNGLYLSHLNIILDSWKRLTDDDSYKTLNSRISLYLAEQTLHDARKNIQSYPALEYRWPADETATLYSLWLYDKNYGTSISQKPIETWMQYMNQHGTDAKTGLFVSELTGTYQHAQEPRGCALSWSIRYMASFAPEKAKEQWVLYKQNYEQKYGMFAGFREWPRGVSHSDDVDSGPLILENGVAATAFAIGASSALGDHATYNQLQRTETATRALLSVFGNNATEEVADSFFASAIDLNMHTLPEKK